MQISFCTTSCSNRISVKRARALELDISHLVPSAPRLGPQHTDEPLCFFEPFLLPLLSRNKKYLIFWVVKTLGSNASMSWLRVYIPSTQEAGGIHSKTMSQKQRYTMLGCYVHAGL